MRSLHAQLHCSNANKQENAYSIHSIHYTLALLTFGCCWGWQVLVSVRWGKPALTAAHHLTGYCYWNPLWPTDLEWVESDDPTHKGENWHYHRSRTKDPLWSSGAISWLALQLEPDFLTSWEKIISLCCHVCETHKGFSIISEHQSSRSSVLTLSCQTYF